ncbi:hypothetical protein [Nocardia paucivorans]|nr:hypothetical protein [Nocardia paucivorans]
MRTDRDNGYAEFGPPYYRLPYYGLRTEDERIIGVGVDTLFAAAIGGAR